MSDSQQVLQLSSQSQNVPPPQPGPSSLITNSNASTTDSTKSAESTVSTAAMPVELNKDGAVSKMRLHRGNVPSLPQTKLCPLCPAKFTRTTHLNRHLRTRKSFTYFMPQGSLPSDVTFQDTNERLHECDVRLVLSLSPEFILLKKDSAALPFPVY